MPDGARRGGAILHFYIPITYSLYWDDRGCRTNLEFYNVYQGAWKLSVNEGGHSFVANFKLPEMLDLSKASEGAQVTQAASLLLALKWAKLMFRQFPDSLPGWLAGFLFYTRYEFLFSQNVWCGKYGNVGYNIGHGIFLWLLSSSVGRYCVHLFLFLFHFNVRTIMVQDGSSLYLGLVAHWLTTLSSLLPLVSASLTVKAGSQYICHWVYQGLIVIILIKNL